MLEQVPLNPGDRVDEAHVEVVHVGPRRGRGGVLLLLLLRRHSFGGASLL
jgi:hypothetical protein